MMMPTQRHQNTENQRCDLMRSHKGYFAGPDNAILMAFVSCCSIFIENFQGIEFAHGAQTRAYVISPNVLAAAFYVFLRFL